jgi:hypothetical protein
VALSNKAGLGEEFYTELRYFVTKAADKPQSFSIRERDMGNFHQGRNLWKWAEAKLWYFVAALHTNVACVLIIVCISTGI